MTEKPVNWIVCSRDGLSDDEWRELRLFLASEIEKDAASCDTDRMAETPLGGSGRSLGSAVPAEQGDAQ